jgi:mannose-1-phosphate guanylyltransferase
MSQMHIPPLVHSSPLPGERTPKQSLLSHSPNPSPRRQHQEKHITPLKIVVLIGGPSKGTRFRPLTFECPKPLFPIGGKPMIAHHIEAALKLHSETDEYKVEIFLMGFFKKELFKGFCDDWFTSYDQDIVYLEEPSESLGTGGGILHFEKEILGDSPPETKVIVMNADICSSFPLFSLLKSHDVNFKRGGKCTMMATHIPQKDTTHFGVLVLGEANQVVHYVEKPHSYVNDIVNCGVYCFESSVFRQLSKFIEVKHVSLENEIITPLMETGGLYAHLLMDKDYWCQIKTASGAVVSSGLYLKQKNSKNIGTQKHFQCIGDVEIESSADIHPTAKIGPNVTIGENVKIGKGVRISNSIILDGVIIKDFALVTHSIVGWRSSIGKWARIEGHPNHHHGDNLSEKEEKITITGNDVVVDNEVLLRDSIVLPHKQLSQNICNRIIL